MKSTRKKHAVHATISPLAKRQLDALVNSHHLFASGSEAVDKAISFMYYAMNSCELAQGAEGFGLNIPQSRWG